MVLTKAMITNVTTIIEMLQLNGNSNTYQQKKQLLDEDGLELLTKVRRILYIANHRKNTKHSQFLISITSPTTSDAEATPLTDDTPTRDVTTHDDVNPFVEDNTATSDDKASDINNNGTTYFFNIGDDAQHTSIGSSYGPVIEQLLAKFKVTNDTIKHLEFTTYLHTIKEADAASEYIRVHGDTMNDSDAAEYTVAIQHGINTQMVIDTYLADVKRQTKQQRKHNKKHRSR